MPIPIQRRLNPTAVRAFGSGREAPITPNLTHIQTASYEDFLQSTVDSRSRKLQGL